MYLSLSHRLSGHILTTSSYLFADSLASVSSLTSFEFKISSLWRFFLSRFKSSFTASIIFRIFSCSRLLHKAFSSATLFRKWSSFFFVRRFSASRSLTRVLASSSSAWMEDMEVAPTVSGLYSRSFCWKYVWCVSLSHLVAVSAVLCGDSA